MRPFTTLLSSAVMVLGGIAPPAAGSQIFVLDFDADGGSFHHDYTTAERDQITSEMNALFAPLGMSAVQAPPASGPYSTVSFNAAVAGTASVDLRNVDPDDDALVNAKRMLDILGVSSADMTSDKIVRTSINIGMHEALHLVGARHQDAFTYPGQGVSSSSLRDNYDPDYLGPFEAGLTDRALMSATTLLGISEEKVTRDNFFISPRTALKARLGEDVPVTAQLSGINSPSTAQPLAATRFEVPNTMPADATLPPELGGGPANELQLTAEAFVVTGTITQAEIDDESINPSHYYAVPILPGMPYTIEVFSDVLDHRTGFTPFDTALSVLVRDPDNPSTPILHDYYGTLGSDGLNRDGWEGIDPAMVDLIAPDFPYAFSFEGQPYMLVEVWSQSGFGQEPAPGDYELVIYTIIPEPASGAMLLLLGATSVLHRRRPA